MPASTCAISGVDQDGAGDMVELAHRGMLEAADVHAEEAALALEIATRQDGASPILLRELAAQLYKLRQFKAAQRVILRCLAIAPMLPGARGLLAVILMARGARDAAAIVQRAAIAQDGEAWEPPALPPDTPYPPQRDLENTVLAHTYPDLFAVLENAEQWEYATDAEIAALQIPHRELILFLIRERRDWWSRLPGTYFTEHGYDRVGQLLPAEECDRLIEVVNGLAGDRSRMINDTAYYVRRAEATHKGGHKVYDKKTSSIFNFQDLDERVNAFFNSGIAEEIFFKRVGKRAILQSIVVYISQAEGFFRQPLHVDGFGNNFKLFISLSDLATPEQGPFSVVPGSHLHVMRRWRARTLNDLHNIKNYQMEAEYDYMEAIPLTLEQGHGVLASVTTAHAGWPFHTKGARYLLVCQFTTDLNWQGPYCHGRPVTSG